MPRQTTPSSFQAAQRGPQHVGLGELEASGDAAPSNGQAATLEPLTGSLVGPNIHGIGPDTDGGPNPDYDPSADPLATIADHLRGLNVEAGCTVEMPLSMVTGKVREASYSLPAEYAPTENDIVLEAERIWTSFTDNRSMPSQTPAASILEPQGGRQAENGTNPSNPSQNHILRVPSDAEFGDDDDFFVSSALKARADVLRDRHQGLFGHLDRLPVVYLWKKAGGKAKGLAVYGKTTKPTGLLKLFSESTFVIWLAADHCRGAYYGNPEIEQLLFREMLHTGESEPDEETGRGGGPALVPHQLEIFHAEIEVYGLNAVILREAAPLFRQAVYDQEPLFRPAGADPAGDVPDEDV